MRNEEDGLNVIVFHKPLHGYQVDLMGMFIDKCMDDILEIEEKKFKHFLSFCNKGYYTKKESDYMDYYRS